MAKVRPIAGVSWRGSDGPDVFTGSEGNDTLSGGLGDDRVDGGGGSDSIYGNGGADSLAGGAGNDTISGHEGNDTIEGGDGDDVLYGQEGDDIVSGGGGNDTIGTGPGNDIVSGGLGADRFTFTANFESELWHHRVTDFSGAQGDVIDLRAIDADGDASNNGRKGNTDFTVVTASSGAAGEAWLVPILDPSSGQQTGTSIYLNTDSDTDADLRIDVTSAVSLTWGVDIFG